MRDGCWVWTGCLHRKGYGRFGWQGRVRQAHRVVYETLVGDIPDGMQIDHLCRNRACVNPDHLEPVSAAENQKRGAGPGGVLYELPTVCKRGHDLTSPGAWLTNRPRRMCRMCQRIRARDYEDRKVVGYAPG